MPRILVGGKTGILDNVKKIVLISGNNVVVSCGKYISVSGRDLIVRQLSEERMFISGDIDIEFFGSRSRNRCIILLFE